MDSPQQQRIRLRHPGGQATLALPTTATVSDLLQQIAEKTSLSAFDLKYGYPPKQLWLQDFPECTSLSNTDIQFDGEQLIVSPKFSPIAQEKERERPEEMYVGPPAASSARGRSAVSYTNVRKPSKSMPLSRKASTMNQDAPEVPLASHNATLVLRVMPDDNSCLFRAFNTAFFGFMDNMTELRSVVAQNVQANPGTYSAVVLDQKPDDYCRWIQTDDAWGGAIELDILSKHFDVEICSIDVQTLRVDRYNEDCSSRCILVYSGIHYDAIALSPSDPPHTHSITPPDFDTKVFDSSEESILKAAIDLCRTLQKKHYFTDTAKFIIKCNVCGTTMTGERGATDHATRTGHMDFGEAG